MGVVENETDVGVVTLPTVSDDKRVVVKPGDKDDVSPICSFRRPTSEMGVSGGVMTDFLVSPTPVVAVSGFATVDDVVHVLMVSGDNMEVVVEGDEFCVGAPSLSGMA